MPILKTVIVQCSEGNVVYFGEVGFENIDNVLLIVSDAESISCGDVPGVTIKLDSNEIMILSVLYQMGYSVGEKECFSGKGYIVVPPKYRDAYERLEPFKMGVLDGHGDSCYAVDHDGGTDTHP